MSRRALPAAVIAAAVLLTSLVAVAAQARPSSSARHHVLGNHDVLGNVVGSVQHLLPTAHVCSAPRPGLAACDAIIRLDVTGGLLDAGRTQPAHPARKATTYRPPSAGLFPAALQNAYALPSATAGRGQTIAIVDAYDDPYAESDLAVYRSQFGLPACTTANGCFRKVDQNGAASYPRANSGWAQEISLDLDVASAICPNCHLLLVEADSASIRNLGTAVNTAAQLGATVINNSYGSSDLPDSSYGSYYDHPGIAITASAGDSGYGLSYPASSDYVTAVGGTRLTVNSSGARVRETAWSNTGSGCSAYNAQPSGQSSLATGCAKRAVADVSAVADPQTGIAIFDSFASGGRVGWLVFGGTSAAAPIIAGAYALAGNAAGISGGGYPYAHPQGLYDVTAGSNGSCRPRVLCTAGPGFDGPTGLGTPNGVSSF